MIIVRLKGGLGNQMFQYATARHLAVRNETCLKLDLGSFSRYPLRSYRLNHYNIAASPASGKELRGFAAGHRKVVRRTVRAAARWLPGYDWQWFVQKGRDYDPSLLGLRGNIYLEGTWQSVKYFSEISSLVRQELTLKTQLTHASLQVAEKITNTEAVSLHVRRGDYASDVVTKKKHGLCGLDYYERGIDLIAQQAPSPHFFVFSDDPSWTQNHLSSKYPMTFVTHNGEERDYEDLFLVSMCRHHIIANSTFSWWGAWLCRNDDKIVIAPRQWFRSVEFDVEDLFPSSWRAI
jgi:hypothetical protein